MRNVAAVAALTCVACGNSFQPARAVETVFVTDDALAAHVGGPRPPPESYEDEERIVTVLDGAKTRFAPSDPAVVKLVAGADDEDAYVVLGKVFGGEAGSLGASPPYADALRRAAALIGADAVLDVHVDGWGLSGIAARLKSKPNDGRAW
jgi:hypothetical protein